MGLLSLFEVALLFGYLRSLDCFVHDLVVGAMKKTSPAASIPPTSAVCCKSLPDCDNSCSDCAVLQITAIHQWQDTLWGYTHGSLTPTPDPSCRVFQQEAITHSWMQLTKATQALTETHPQLCQWPELSHWGQVRQQMDQQLGLSEGPPPKPLLWRHGGHPSLPASLQLCHMQMQLHQLCAVTRSASVMCHPWA